MPLCQNGQCTNTEGSYKCTCLPGFVASAEPHKCIPAIPERPTETANRKGSEWVPLKSWPYTTFWLALILRQQRWIVQTFFPWYYTHSMYITNTSYYTQLCYECITWDLEFHQISICLKGIVWTDILYSITPGNLKKTISTLFSFIFPFFFVTILFICVVLTGLCKLSRFQMAYLTPLCLNTTFYNISTAQCQCQGKCLVENHRQKHFCFIWINIWPTLYL